MMSTIFNPEWWKAAGIRALKTVCQTAVAGIATATVLEEVNWVGVVSSAVLAGILSILTSLAGIPEVSVELEMDELEIEDGDDD